MSINSGQNHGNNLKRYGGATSGKTYLMRDQQGFGQTMLGYPAGIFGDITATKGTLN